MTESHQEEIARIMTESDARVRDRRLVGRDLLAERRACSAAIAAACERHRTDLNAPLAVPATASEGA